MSLETAVRLSGLIKKFDSFTAVDDMSFEVRRGEFVTLLGPSGCGKSTTLRCIAGLIRAEGGEVYIADRLVAAPASNVFVPPEQRNVGMVFQSFAVWPHMNVFENVAFPLRLRGWSKGDIRRTVGKCLELVRLNEKAKSLPTELSGGQQQRLALARSLAYEPDLLLLDEPLSNLDAKLRVEMREELLQIQRETGQTFVFVTHDQVEASTMSDRIVLMNHGRIIQIGTPLEVFDSPSTAFAAAFLGGANILQGVLSSKDGVVDVPGLGSIACRLFGTGNPGSAATLVVRPKDVTISASSDGDNPSVTYGSNQVGGRIVFTAFELDAHVHKVELENGVAIRVEGAKGSLEGGQHVALQFDPQRTFGYSGEAVFD